MKTIKDNPVLRETSHTLIPLILLYALYVQFHGELGPGGGFQAGVIFTVGFILYALVYGGERIRTLISPRTAECLACFGLLLFSGTGFVSVLLGGTYLDYDQLHTSPIMGQQIGIIFVELGVGVGIFGVFISIFYLFSEQA